MAELPVPDLNLYTRPGCHLCEDAAAIVQALLEERAAGGRRTAALRPRDITTNPDWERSFVTTIPVLEIRDRRLDLATSPARIRRFLDEALDGAMV
jgi:hypothetical protein